MRESRFRRLITLLAHLAGIIVPFIFCGATYPCNNLQLVATVSAAGDSGIVQPISLIYLHGHDFCDVLPGVEEVKPAEEIMRRFAAEVRQAT